MGFNNHGLLTLNELKAIYKNLYYRKVKDEISDEWMDKLGWRTSPRTKPILIGNLDKAIRDGLTIPSKGIIRELLTYIIEDDGKTNASEGNHDDRVMALACAVQGYMESDHEIKPKDKVVPMNTPAYYLKKAQEKKANKYTWNR